MEMQYPNLSYISEDTEFDLMLTYQENPTASNARRRARIRRYMTEGTYPAMALDVTSIPTDDDDPYDEYTDDDDQDDNNFMLGPEGKDPWLHFDPELMPSHVIVQSRPSSQPHDPTPRYHLDIPASPSPPPTSPTPQPALPLTDKVNVFVDKCYYTSVIQLCKLVNKAMVEAYNFNRSDILIREHRVWFTYEHSSDRVMLNSHYLFCVLVPRKGTQLLNALGFEPKLNHGLAIQHQAENSPSLGYPYTSLYVYIDIVHHQIVGDTMTNLLRTVPVSTYTNPTSHISFDKAYYERVSKGYISTVEVGIYDDKGNVINFKSGKVILVLHFRRSNLTT